MSRRFRLLIAYDGSESSDAALRDLHQAGLPKKLEAVVISFADTFHTTGLDPKDPGQPKWLTESIRKSHAEAHENIDKAYAAALVAVKFLNKRFPHWKVRADADADNPAWGIVKRSDSWRPDLTLLGSHRLTTLGRLLLGSVSQKVLAHVSCSVRIARNTRVKRNSHLRLVLGFDGSANAESAVRAVSERSWPKGTVLRLVTALDSKLDTLIDVEAPIRGINRMRDPFRDKRWLQDMMQPAVAKLRRAGLSVEPGIQSGEPIKVLLGEARRWKADSLFVGARGLGAVKRFLMGSVSTAVAEQADCTVEVVRIRNDRKTGSAK